MKYDYKEIEKKWQDRWDAENAFAATTDYSKPKYYALVEFPYPSGAGLHVGHPRSYTALDIARKDILPAVLAFSKSVADTALSKKALLPNLNLAAEEALLTKLSVLTDSLVSKIEALADSLADGSGSDLLAHAKHSHHKLVPAMAELRAVADELETIVGKEYWPLPTYGELLFNV